MCECGQSFMNAFNLKRHQSSKAHEFNMQCVGENITSDESGMYNCNTCNYSTVFKGNFRKHLLSSRHKHESANRHATIPPSEVSSNDIKPEMLLQLITTLMKQQQESQTNLINKLLSRDTSDSHDTTTTTTTTSTTNSHNKTTNNKRFNLNVFLNSFRA